MKILADQHISPRTVDFLNRLGHDAVRASDRLPPNASDIAILALAENEQRVVLTQDLDFTGLIATSGKNAPSLIVLRLGSPSVDHVNSDLESILATVQLATLAGAIISVDDQRVRIRPLPIQ